MTRTEILKLLDDLDDGQEDCEAIARPLRGFCLGDALYLKGLVEADLKTNPTE